MHKKANGFTLIEMLLVLVIISILIYASIGYMQQRTLQMRIDRVSTQMQQILNAGMSYYVNNGKWPTMNEMTANGNYLPSTPLTSPWGKPYFVSPPVLPSQQFAVWTSITGTNSASVASIIAGTLPLSYTSNTSGTPPPNGNACVTGDCHVVGQVNIPGQNLNNAAAVNFAGIYHHGGCVPIPKCPVDSAGHAMKPEIMVMPVSVSGLNDDTNNVFPISSFTAYAVSREDPFDWRNDTQPPACKNSTDDGTRGTRGNRPAGNCPSNINGAPAAGYWRVCLQVITQKGNVQLTYPQPPGNPNFGKNVTLVAITRCAINNEPGGSKFTVFSD